MKERFKEQFNKHWRKITVSAVALLVVGSIVNGFFRGVGSYTFDRARQEFTNKYYIAVIMSENGKAFTIPSEFLSGFGSAPTLISERSKQVEIHYEDDILSEEQAARVARKLVNDENCILVIGNSNSQLTKITLNEFLRSQNPPAYILPIATATELLSMAKQEKHQAVLRMVPDDDNQASVIKRFAAKKTVVILVDEENQTYSDGLSKSIAHNMNTNGGLILSMKTYGNSNRFRDLYQKLNPSQLPDLIIFVGVSNNGLLLIDELLSLNLKVPVIFTDGCTVEDLIKRAAMLKADRWVLSAVTLGNKSNRPTYQPIGKDAYELAKRIIDDCNGSTRKDIYECIKKNKSNIRYTGGDAGNYQFDNDGNNKKMEFHVYKIENDGKLTLEPGF